MTLRYATTTNANQKTLDAALNAGVTASATFNNTTGIQNKAGVFVVDRVDTNGTLTPNKREYIGFTGTSGSTVVTLTRNIDGGGSDQDHAVGAIVEFGPDAVWADGVMDALDNLVDATGSVDTTKVVTPTGTQTLTNKTLTAPKINEDVALTSSATELNVLHGIPATLTATELGYVDGVTSSIQTQINAISSSVGADGWTAVSGWSYASASTITVPSGAAALYQKGDRIKLTQTTVKYFVIVSVADTVLTVTGGTDYTVANAAITSPYYSHQSNPIGYPTWFNWTPTFSCSGSMTISAGSIDLKRFQLTGTTCTISISYVAFTLGGSADLSIYFTLPIDSVRTVTNTVNNANAIPIVDGGTGKIGQITIKDSAPGSAMVRNTNTSNWTLGSTNSYIFGTHIYEI